MARNKTFEYVFTKDGIKVKKPKTLIVRVNDKYVAVKPDHNAYSFMDYYGDVVSRVEL